MNKKKNTTLVVQQVVKRPKQKRQRSRKSKISNAYSKLIADPCDGPLVQGMYGSSYGYISRFTNFQNFWTGVTGWSSTANASGYILWFPTYSSTADLATGNTYINMFGFITASETTAPTVADFGKANAATYTTTAASCVDPAYSFVNSDTCQDARAVAACLRMSYKGATGTSQGLIYPLTNVPITAVLGGGAGNTCASVSHLMQYSNKEVRANQTTESIWRPNSYDSKFRGVNEGALQTSAAAGGNTAETSAAKADNITGFGFAFTNLSKPSDYNIKAFKVMEWRSEPNIGMPQVPPKGVDNPSILSSALNVLDRANPDWQTKLIDYGTDMLVNGLQSVVLGGSKLPVNTNPINYVMRR